MGQSTSKKAKKSSKDKDNDVGAGPDHASGNEELVNGDSHMDRGSVSKSASESKKRRSIPMFVSYLVLVNPTHHRGASLSVTQYY